MAKAKKGKAKIPKEVGGVKVPKKLRKIGKKAIALAQQPMVSEIAAAALLGAAAALREGKDLKGRDAAKAAGAAGDAAKAAAKEAGAEVSKLSEALKMLAGDLARRAVDAMAEGKGPARAPHLARADAPDPAPQAAEAKKKQVRPKAARARKTETA
ncbi:MAG: hypothetical protein ACK40O_02500 [Allosphingosinicella sp.]